MLELWYTGVYELTTQTLAIKKLPGVQCWHLLFWVIDSEAAFPVLVISTLAIA